MRVKNATIRCRKGRRQNDPANTPTEHVLLIPPRLTKSAYQDLLACQAGIVPRSWHLEGRFGSRTHVVDPCVVNAIPILCDQEDLHEIAKINDKLKDLLETESVQVIEKEFVANHRAWQDIPHLDARIHPELEPSGYTTKFIGNSNSVFPRGSNEGPVFKYGELFGGIGGFGVALDALGGKCVFYSEIELRCRETYALNFDTPSNLIFGDIYDVPNEAFPSSLDILVAGFPCQPFSSLGNQPGTNCEKGRGILFLQIVRCLEISRPKSFLLENVPGLLEMKESLTTIVNALRGAGYKVTAEICSARGLTATNRKRLFIVGIREDFISSASNNLQTNGVSQCGDTSRSLFDLSFFKFPFIPDLQLCSHDILEYDSLPKTELEILRLSDETWEQLSQRGRRWHPHHLAWPSGHCHTLTSHYGNAVGRGESQLVPSASPHHPRRFSVRECARIMGFPNSFKFCGKNQSTGEMAYRKMVYRMLGNAVCPPLVAALAGSVLEAAHIPTMCDANNNESWTTRGRRIAVELANAALCPDPVALPPGCVVLERSENEWISICFIR